MIDLNPSLSVCWHPFFVHVLLIDPRLVSSVACRHPRPVGLRHSGRLALQHTVGPGGAPEGGALQNNVQSRIGRRLQRRKFHGERLTSPPPRSQRLSKKPFKLEHREQQKPLTIGTALLESQSLN
jgi:hypothetical protein